MTKPEIFFNVGNINLFYIIDKKTEESFKYEVLKNLYECFYENYIN